MPLPAFNRLLSVAIIVLAFVLTVLADIAFTEYPRQVQYGSTHEIKWRTDDSNAPVTLAVMRGTGADTSMVILMAGAGREQRYSWAPTREIAAADDYVLMVAQGDEVAYSSDIAVGVPRRPVRASASTSAQPSAITPWTTMDAITLITASETASASSTSSTVRITNPTPTSSWDAPRKEDYTLTTDDRVAIGIGIPIALLVLGTIGWWRAAKFFMHRKITGEPKLPVYETGKASAPSVVIGSGLMRETGRQGSRAPSLWGASSGRGSQRSRDPSPLRPVEQVVVTPPSPVAGSSPRAGTLIPAKAPASRTESQIPAQPATGRVPSGLRQTWTP